MTQQPPHPYPGGGPGEAETHDQARGREGAAARKCLSDGGCLCGDDAWDRLWGHLHNSENSKCRKHTLENGRSSGTLLVFPRSRDNIKPDKIAKCKYRLKVRVKN